MGANDKLLTGLIGSGGRGRHVWGNFLEQPEIEPVAVCDVYRPFLEKGVRMTGDRAQPFHDFRKLLNLRDLDAVIIATPDHWHALMTIAACQAGKDIYCEKPLSLTILEGRRMVEAARRYKRVVQTGSQQRSGAHYAAAVKLIQDGEIGEVHRIHCGYQRNALPGFKPTEMANGDTTGFDYNAWLGPAPQRPFDPFRCIYNFRWFWDYSGGQMTNWGAHHLDIARWIIGATAPQSVAGFGGRYALTDGGETPDIQQVTYQFPNVVVTWTGSEVSEGPNPVTLEVFGSRGTMSLTRTEFSVKPEYRVSGKQRVAAMEAMHMNANEIELAHVRNFIDCSRSRNRPNADVEEGHLSANMCHLSNISTRLGRSLRWDTVHEQIIGDEEANKCLMRPYREPWKLNA